MVYSVGFKPDADSLQPIVLLALFAYRGGYEGWFDDSVGRVQPHPVQSLQNRIIQMIVKPMKLAAKRIRRLLLFSESQSLRDTPPDLRVLRRVGETSRQFRYDRITQSQQSLARVAPQALVRQLFNQEWHCL